MKLANESNILPSDDLSYLERLIDFEGGVDRGPMSGKKYLIYAPGKTGTVSIYTSILKQLSQENDYSDVLNMMLHNHNNASIVSIANGFESIGKAELLKKNSNYSAHFFSKSA
ncbi:hypothetical protein [Marinobacter metalliresistant]|uniref:Uncharacterized protein n=1 Tax=Marinobacter metalliresistant TaxID=2961995 RepID=A0ABZ2W5D8_9GAMM